MKVLIHYERRIGASSDALCFEEKVEDECLAVLQLCESTYRIQTEAKIYSDNPTKVQPFFHCVLSPTLLYLIEHRHINQSRV